MPCALYAQYDNVSYALHAPCALCALIVPCARYSMRRLHRMHMRWVRCNKRASMHRVCYALYMFYVHSCASRDVALATQRVSLKCHVSRCRPR